MLIIDFEKMKELLENILSEIDVEIDEIDLYGYDIVENSLSMVHRLQAVLNDLKTKLQTYSFPAKEDEITFFKTQKPEKFLAGCYFSIRYTG